MVFLFMRLYAIRLEFILHVIILFSQQYTSFHTEKRSHFRISDPRVLLNSKMYVLGREQTRRGTGALGRQRGERARRRRTLRHPCQGPAKSPRATTRFQRRMKGSRNHSLSTVTSSRLRYHR